MYHLMRKLYKFNHIHITQLSKYITLFIHHLHPNEKLSFSFNTGTYAPLLFIKAKSYRYATTVTEAIFVARSQR